MSSFCGVSLGKRWIVMLTFCCVHACTVYRYLVLMDLMDIDAIDATVAVLSFIRAFCGWPVSSSHGARGIRAYQLTSHLRYLAEHQPSNKHSTATPPAYSKTQPDHRPSSRSYHPFLDCSRFHPRGSRVSASLTGKAAASSQHDAPLAFGLLTRRRR